MEPRGNSRGLRGQRYLPFVNSRLADFIESGAHFRTTFEECNDFFRLWLKSNPPPQEMAFLGCNDRYFLLRGLLGRDDVNHPWLYARCREVEQEPDGFLDLWSREHYKSTIITTAGIIQEIVSDPEITIGIFAINNKVAKPFLQQIQHEFERNERLKRTYADVLFQSPRKEAPLWSIEKGLIVRRKSNPKEATIEAYGLVDGMPTGRHFRLMVYDDVVTEKSVTNEDQIKKTTESWELSDNLGAGDDFRKWHIGTRYHFGDTYGQIMERGILKPRLYPATDNGRITGKPVFFSAKKWAHKVKTQRSTLAAQLLQNPIAGKDQIFRLKDAKSYVVRPSTLNVYIMCDPSLGKQNQKSGAASDRTAIAVVGVDANGNRYLLDGYRHRMRLSDRWLKLKQLYKKWSTAPGVQSVNVGYERYGMLTDVEYMEEKMETEGPVFSMRELNWAKQGGQSKTHRVQRLEPYFTNNQFYLPRRIWRPGMVDADGRATDAVWNVDEAKDTLVYRPVKGRFKAEQDAIDRHERHLINIGPIKRVDENDDLYDLTTAFLDEYHFFPFAPKDDLIDAVSRIEDMDVIRPVVHEDTMLEELEAELYDG